MEGWGEVNLVRRWRGGERDRDRDRERSEEEKGRKMERVYMTDNETNEANPI